MTFLALSGFQRIPCILPGNIPFCISPWPSSCSKWVRIWLLWYMCTSRTGSPFSTSLVLQSTSAWSGGPWFKPPLIWDKTPTSWTRGPRMFRWRTTVVAVSYAIHSQAGKFVVRCARFTVFNFTRDFLGRDLQTVFC